MSASFLTYLFPDLAAAWQIYMPSLWKLAFPARIQAQYALPSYQMGVGSARLFMPSLIPIAIMGMVTGLRGYHNDVRATLWRKSFWYYACMNMSALFCHCFIPYASQLKRWAWGLDVGFTCVSSMFLMAAALSDRVSLAQTKVLHKYANAAPLPLIILALWGNQRQVPWLNEVMYIGTTLAAVSVIAMLELLIPLQRKLGRGWMWGMAASSVIAASGIPLDRFLCPAFKAHFNHVHLLFLGCTGAFWCLEKYLAANENQKRH